MKRLKEVLWLRPLFFLWLRHSVAILIGLIFFLAPSLEASALNELSPLCRKAYNEVICFQFDKAQVSIGKIKVAEPESIIPVLLENDIDFIKLMINEEDKDLEKLISNYDNRLRIIAGSNRSTPWYLFAQAEIWFQLGISRIKTGEYVAAGMNLNRAYRLLDENNRLYPLFMPNQLRLGLMHALVGTIPPYYRWIANALNFEGSVKEGTREVVQVYDFVKMNPDWDFLLPETTFILAYLSLNISGNKLEAVQILKDLSDPLLNKWISLSPLVALTYANLSMKTGKNDRAIEVLSSVTSAYPFHYLNYLLGVAKLNRLDKDAHLPLLKFLASFKGKNYIKAAYQHLAWYYILQDNTSSYILYMDRIRLRGSTLVDNDKQALLDAGKKDMPQPCLLKARLLFDGGYYNRAREQLVSFIQTPSFSDSRLKLEYTYRMARVCDEEGQKVQALNWYLSTLEMGRNAPNYFAANASLHMGIIYENSGKKDLALKYYNECLSLDYEEYNLSITQKAKAGVNRLKK